MRNTGVLRTPSCVASATSSSTLAQAQLGGAFGLELGPVDPGHHSPAQVVFRRQLLLIGEDEIVELPEGIRAAEGKYGHGRVRGGPGKVVVRQGRILPHQAKLGRPVDPFQFAEGLAHGRAERALKVTELDDGDRRFRTAPGRILGCHRHHASGQLDPRRSRGGSWAAFPVPDRPIRRRDWGGWAPRTHCHDNAALPGRAAKQAAAGIARRTGKRRASWPSKIRIFMSGKVPDPFRDGDLRKFIDFMQSGRRDICLDQPNPKGGMKHAQRKGTLLARHLIMKEFHGLDGAAAVCVVLTIRSEHRRKEHARFRARRSIKARDSLLPLEAKFAFRFATGSSTSSGWSYNCATVFRPGGAPRRCLIQLHPSAASAVVLYRVYPVVLGEQRRKDGVVEVIRRVANHIGLP
jgi:hypothetical protein